MNFLYLKNIDRQKTAQPDSTPAWPLRRLVRVRVAALSRQFRFASRGMALVLALVGFTLSVGQTLFAQTVAESDAVSNPVDDKPNVLVVIADDAGWGDFRFNGNTNVATPRLNQLAEQGILFTRFFVCPLCAHTRAEFLTGRYHQATGVRGVSRGFERIDLDETTIADCFQAAGYRTGLFGKWHNGSQYPYHPRGRGFDEFFGFTSGHWSRYFDPWLEHNGQWTDNIGYISDLFTERAMEFMTAESDQPFFAVVSFNTPHWPAQVPEEYWARFEDRGFPLRGPDGAGEDLQKTRSALAMVENIDWNVGRLVDAIDSAELTERTIILFFSDNGPNSRRWNGGLKGIKGSTDEGGVRSPMIIRWEGHLVEPGRECEQVCAAIDLYPTLLKLVDCPNVGQKLLDGMSLVPLLDGSAKSLDFRMLVNSLEHKGSVRTQKYRLDDDGALFDMDEDPGQTTDIADRHPDVAALLLTYLIRFKQSIAAQLDEKRRPFTIGHEDFNAFPLPARDADLHGDLKRSSIHPNCSWITDWNATDEKISWPVEVQSNDALDVCLYYTAPESSIGSEIKVTCGNASATWVVDQAFDPPEWGMTVDRFPRSESYDKPFRAVKIGRIQLERGITEVSVQLTKVLDQRGIDLRMIEFRR